MYEKKCVHIMFSLPLYISEGPLPTSIWEGGRGIRKFLLAIHHSADRKKNLSCDLFLSHVQYEAAVFNEYTVASLMQKDEVISNSSTFSNSSVILTVDQERKNPC